MLPIISICKKDILIESFHPLITDFEILFYDFFWNIYQIYASCILFNRNARLFIDHFSYLVHKEGNWDNKGWYSVRTKRKYSVQIWHFVMQSGTHSFFFMFVSSIVFSWKYFVFDAFIVNLSFAFIGLSKNVSVAFNTIFRRTESGDSIYVHLSQKVCSRLMMTSRCYSFMV